MIHVHTFLDRLVELAAGALTIPVLDGPSVQRPERTVLCVGADMDTSATPFVTSWAGQGAQRRNLTLDVPCLLYARDGSTSLKPLRDAAAGVLEALDGLFRPAADLGVQGVTARAQLGTSGTWAQFQNADGAEVVVSFTVTVDCRI